MRLAPRNCLLILGLLLLAPAGALAALPDSRALLVERSNALLAQSRQAYDLARGLLGPLKVLRLISDGCTTRIISGPENRIVGDLAGVEIGEDGHDPLARSLWLRPGRGPHPKDRPCLTVMVATANDFILSGDAGGMVVFDRPRMLWARVFINPSPSFRLWFEAADIGWLDMKDNAAAQSGASGRVKYLSLSGARSQARMGFDQVEASDVRLSATTTGVQFVVRAGPGTQLGYYQPARAPGALAQLYPVWVDGDPTRLETPAGRVDAMRITPQKVAESRALREQALAALGAAAREPLAEPPPNAPLTRMERVAKYFQPDWPAGVQLNQVQLWKDGGALEGLATSRASAQAAVRSMAATAGVTHASLAYATPQGSAFKVRLLFTLDCRPAAPAAALCEGS